MAANAATLLYKPRIGLGSADEGSWAGGRSGIKVQFPVRGATTSDYSAIEPGNEFAGHFAKLLEIKSEATLWPEGAERPAFDSIAWAELILRRLQLDALLPTRIVASAEGGIAICFVRGDKYSDIECLNSGAILGVTSNRRDRPVVWDVEPNASGIARASSKIRRFLEESAAEENVQERQRR